LSDPQHSILQGAKVYGALVQKLEPSRALFVAATAALLVTGALEAGSVAMLAPLLEALNPSNTKAHESSLFTFLSRVFPTLSHGTFLLITAGTVLALVTLKNLASYFSVLLTTRLRGDAATSMREKLVHRILHNPLQQFESKTTGDLADVVLVEGGKSVYAMDLLIYGAQRITMAGSYLTAILFLSWQLTLLTGALGLLLAASGLLLSRRILGQGRLVGAANSKLARRLTEMFGGLRLIRTTHNETAEERAFAEVSREHARLEAKTTQLTNLSFGVNETLAVGGAMAVTAFANHFMLQRGQLSVGEFVAFGLGLVRLLPVLNQLHSLQSGILSLTGSAEKVLELLEAPPERQRQHGTAKLTTLGRGIELEALTLRYGKGGAALDSVSCFIPAGSFFAVVGPSGSGKTTLANLLLRLMEPSSGRILLDGKDYWEFEPKSYHRFVAYVEQEPFLFHATVEENVRYGASDATREQVFDALKIVKLEEFVRALPDGLDTMIGERGATLSGGQKQRLAIARALVRSPQLLILDEPTSALDPATERDVIEAIEAARSGRTVIVIAHRMGTIERADQVLHLERGRIRTLERGAGAPVPKQSA
jgi:ABC-type multidrug transport system fused ATPase/permease subunit